MAEMFEVVGKAVYDAETDTLTPVPESKTFDSAIEGAFWWGFMWAHGIDHLDEDQEKDAKESFERYRARLAGYEGEYLESLAFRGYGDE